MQKLLPLSLENTPAAEVMGGTALAWHEVMVHGRVLDPARDRQRFREAFRTLASRQRRWPAPVDFLEALPRVASEPTPTQAESESSREVGMRHIADLAAKLKIDPVKPHTEADA